MIPVDKIRGIICQKILPLTYDESLSYMELLCKVIYTLNEIISVINDFTPESLDEIKARLDAVEAKNAEQDHDIDVVKTGLMNLNSLMIVLNEQVGILDQTVSSLSETVSSHTTELEDHEIRITELEKYQSQLLLKKNVANIQEGDLFNMSAEQFVGREIHI